MSPYLLHLPMLLLAAISPGVADGVREIETGERIGLDNGLVRIEFQRTTGELVSLRNLDTNDEYLKDTGGDGNPFRAYVDTSELPSALTHPWPELNPPVEGALGGKLIDTRNCTLNAFSFEPDGETTILNLEMEHPTPRLLFRLRVRILAAEPLVEMGLTVVNSGTETHRVMSAVPYLTGLALGENRETNLGVRLREFGQSHAPAWSLNGDIYSRGWAGQWNAAYEPTMDEGIGMIIKDPDISDKIIRRFEDGGMSVLYFDNTELSPGEEISYPVTEVLVHRGDWKFTARRYAKWFRSAFELRKTPEWVDEVGMFVGSWIPHPDAIAEAKKNPGAPGVFHSFRDIERLYLPDHYELKEWAYYWHSILKTDAYNAYDHTDGTYQTRHDLGGASALRDGVVRLEQLGRHLGLYVASKTIRLDSDFFIGEEPRDWMYMGRPDEEIPEGAQRIHACLGYERWQDHIAHVCKRLLWETGAKYIRLDEAGMLFETCHNPAHDHPSPYYGCAKWNLEFYRKVREAMDEVDPEALLFTEGGADLLNIYCNGALRLWWPGREIAPLRLAVPGYLGFSYGAGQIECALQGFVCGNTSPISTGGGFSEHHDRIWGPGLEHFPLCYKEPGRPESIRWHELGYSFVEAARHGDPTDVNPTVPAYREEKLANWDGRLWRSDKYWLMVCGNQAGIRPDKPVEVKLPELPTEIDHAYEFDFETLTRQEIKIRREEDSIYVMTHHGFSAVFFPKPECPPLVEMSDLVSIESGSSAKVRFSIFSPWRKSGEPVKVGIAVQGLGGSVTSLELPGEIEVTVPDTGEAGYYPVLVRGNCLGLKRWIKVTTER